MKMTAFASTAASKQVINNRDLFTHVCSFLDDKQLTSMVEPFKNVLHYNYVLTRLSTKHTLIYGQVQSGKTAKIIEYVKTFKPSFPKIVMIQNNLAMVAQYKTAFQSTGITYVEITKNSIKTAYSNQNVILIMNNKYRKNIIDTYLDINDIHNYCLVMDESDQYYSKIKNTDLFKHANYCLHITATPFKYRIPFDKIIHISPKESYIGINDVQISTIYISEQHVSLPTKGHHITKIIEEDFVKKSHGFMLINCLPRIEQMNTAAQYITTHFPNIPVIVLSTNTMVWRNSVATTHKPKSIPHFIDKFNNDTHCIFIANRYSNRGINYTNSTYTRAITHQVSCVNKSVNTVSFIQKCRIFGNRSVKPHYKPVLYVITNKQKYMGIIQKYMANPVATEENITVKQLRQICKDNGIRRYSNKRKKELLEYLEELGIPMIIRNDSGM